MIVLVRVVVGVLLATVMQDPSVTNVARGSSDEVEKKETTTAGVSQPEAGNPPVLEVAPPKQEVAPPKQEVAPPKQEEAPPKQEEAPPKQEEAPPKQEVAPPKQEVAPPKQEAAPSPVKTGDPIAPVVLDCTLQISPVRSELNKCVADKTFLEKTLGHEREQCRADKAKGVDLRRAQDYAKSLQRAVEDYIQNNEALADQNASCKDKVKRKDVALKEFTATVTELRGKNADLMQGLEAKKTELEQLWTDKAALEYEKASLDSEIKDLRATTNREREVRDRAIEERNKAIQERDDARKETDESKKVRRRISYAFVALFMIFAVGLLAAILRVRDHLAGQFRTRHRGILYSHPMLGVVLRQLVRYETISSLAPWCLVALGGLSLMFIFSVGLAALDSDQSVSTVLLQNWPIAGTLFSPLLVLGPLYLRLENRLRDALSHSRELMPVWLFEGPGPLRLRFLALARSAAQHLIETARMASIKDGALNLDAFERQTNHVLSDLHLCRASAKFQEILKGSFAISFVAEWDVVDEICTENWQAARDIVYHLTKYEQGHVLHDPAVQRAKPG